MTDGQNAKVHAIIHTASAAAASVGAGLAQVPLSDSIVITPIQVTMVIMLGRVFGIELSEGAAKGAVAAAAASNVGRMVSQVLVGWIPVVGNAINASTAAAVTEAIGWMVANDFKKIA